jgi:signal transduction histidine kinase
MGKLFISVSDTGVGIPKAEISKLLRDFVTLQCNAHLNPNGVGLGLSTSKKITNLLHGDITVESTEAGSCFTFHVAFNSSPI